MQFSTNINRSNIFDEFPQYKWKSGLYNQFSNKTITEDKFASSNNQVPDKKHFKKILFGSTVASSILTVGMAGLVLAKGIHGSSFAKFKNRHLAETEITNKAILKSRKAAHKVIIVLESLSNGTAIKDWLADKALRSNKTTSKFADKTTGFFQNIVNKTLGKKYNKAEIKIKDLSSLLKQYKIVNLSNCSEKDLAQKITIKGQTKTLAQWLTELSTQSDVLTRSFDENFSLGARKLRNQKRSRLLSNVKEKIKERFFKNYKSLFTAKNYKGYVNEDVTNEAKNELKKEILTAKKKITNNITAIHDNTNKLLENLINQIDYDDKITLEYIKELKVQLEAFKNCSGVQEQYNREAIIDNICSIINNTCSNINNNPIYTAEKSSGMLALLNEIKSSASKIDEKGALEEIMIILNGLNKSGAKCNGSQIISDLDLKEYSKLANAIVKRLKDATELEAGEYFIKQAELKVGSAPTDIFSLMFPIGAGAYAISKCDNGDERISTILNTCVPLVGTFATFIYGTTKMMYGAKNLALSAASGVVLSKLGKYFDKLYKNSR